MKRCLKFLEMLKMSNNLDFRLFSVFYYFSFLYFPLFRLHEVATLFLSCPNKRRSDYASSVYIDEMLFNSPSTVSLALY